MEAFGILHRSCRQSFDWKKHLHSNKSTLPRNMSQIMCSVVLKEARQFTFEVMHINKMFGTSLIKLKDYIDSSIIVKLINKYSFDAFFDEITKFEHFI